MSELLAFIRAGRKPVIGMVQLGPLPGGSRYRGATIAEVLDPALADAELLARNGVDVLMVQNLGDVPTAMHATPVQIAWMTRVTAEIRGKFGLPVGLNMLENDAAAMFAVASAAGADFVRIKVYVGAMMTPFGFETGQAHAAIKARTSWAADNVAIFADVHDRTGTPVGTSGLAEDIEFALRLGLADGLVLTGKSYAETLQFIGVARKYSAGVPILVGGGVNAANFAEVAKVADGAIVSSSLKDSGSATGRFDPAKVRDFMSAARKVRAA